jgi:threonine synthase
MKFYSTKKQSPAVSFKTALFQGLAPDGGLYFPESFPTFTSEELANLHTLHEVGYAVLRKWIDVEEIPDEDLKKIVEKALTFPMPLHQVGDYSILELFHGPTLAFKDVAASVLARFFEYFLEKEKQDITILVATSGDTGGAMAQAFSGVQHVKVVILYPEGKVSKLQEEQLTRVGDNVLPIVVPGVFDDCQQYVKDAFQDKDLAHLSLSSANSINIGRLLPQVIFHTWAYIQKKTPSVTVVVPSGNMGDATSALFAKKMGVPIDHVVVATNENDALVKYIETGSYHPQQTKQTLSTAMDIGKPNNAERMFEFFDNDHESFKKAIQAYKVSDAETIATIKDVYERYNYLLDFHTSVAFTVAEQHHVPNAIVVSTASPLKFAEELLRETGITVDNSSVLESLQKKEKKEIKAENSYASLKDILQTQIG